MILMSGKYNTAKIMTDQIDDATRTQIQRFLDHPAFSNTEIAIMPDCHAGKGAVIGFTMSLNDYVIPNVIGVDIGCGMLSIKLDAVLPEDFHPISIDRVIREKIPFGFRINENSMDIGSLSDEIEDTCHRIGSDTTKAIRAIGSLGGGNHFIELGKDDTDYWLTIHSGSRNFGLKIAEFYQEKAREHSVICKSRPEKDLEFLAIDSPEAKDYLHDLQVAQRFAAQNRMAMADIICNSLGFFPKEMIESVHNFIGDDLIIRKGATSARLNEKVIIPFNMRDGLAICRGKGNEHYNNSAPHGAGRILSRSKAKKEISMAEYRRAMDGVVSTTVCPETLDESPQAYKDTKMILSNIIDTVDVETFVKPVYNFKATS